MKHLLIPLNLLFLSFFANSQNTPPNFDGIVTEEEWQNAERFDINYEISPGNNVPSPYLTQAFITYTETDLYVGFITYADMKTLRSSIRLPFFILGEPMDILKSKQENDTA